MTYRQTDGRTDRQTDIHTYMHDIYTTTGAHVWCASG